MDEARRRPAARRSLQIDSGTGILERQMSAALTERLVSIGRAAREAGHGSKELIYQSAMQELGLSRATLLRKIKEVTMKPARKRRSDAGDVALAIEEAKIISALLIESMRRNNKRLMSIENAVRILRANN